MHIYIIIKELTNGYLATCPTVPGLTVSAPTREKVVAEAREGLELFFKNPNARPSGEPTPWGRDGDLVLIKIPPRAPPFVPELTYMDSPQMGLYALTVHVTDRKGAEHIIGAIVPTIRGSLHYLEAFVVDEKGEQMGVWSCMLPVTPRDHRDIVAMRTTLMKNFEEFIADPANWDSFPFLK